MRKSLILCSVVLLVAGGFYGLYHLNTPPLDNDLTHLWQTNRTIPEKISLSGYLAANYARQQGDFARAIKGYQSVLEKDPQNTKVLKDLYILAMSQGTPEVVMPYLEQMPQDIRANLLADYLAVLPVFQSQPTAVADFLKVHSTSTKKEILNHLILSWSAAKTNQKKGAIHHLRALKKGNNTYIYAYQTFLIGVYFQDSALIQEGLEIIQEKRLPAVGFFPLLKKYAGLQKNFTDTPLFQQLEKMEKLYPATADLIQTMGQNTLNADTGLAEMLYLLSADGNAEFTKEECLFLNSMALFLNPNKQLALVWGGELIQALGYPQAALNYYEKIPNQSATLLFKKTALLVLTHHAQQAKELMLQLARTNPKNTALLTLMAQNYIELKEYQKALETYHKLIPLLEQNPQNKPLAYAYISRASLYQEQNKPDLMIQDLQKAQALLPDDPMLKNDIGYHLLELGQIEEGFKMVEEAYHQQPTDPLIMDSLAFAYYKKNQPKIALSLAEKALNLKPDNAMLNAHLGDIYQANHRMKEAQFQYRKALDLKSDLTAEQLKQIQQKIIKN